MTNAHRIGHLVAPLTFALVVAACGRRAEGASGQAVADTGNVDTTGGRQPSGARLVAVIGGLDTPESVRYDPEQDVFFISDMTGYGSDKDGNGLIARVGAADPHQWTPFARGGERGVTLNAPKGMVIHGDTLWVADIDALRGFDRHTGAPLATVDFGPQHAVLLNDVAVGPDGTIRVTDSGILMTEKGILKVGGDKIFVVGPGHSVSVLASGPQLETPNGITWDSSTKRWILVTFDRFSSHVFASPERDTTRAVLATGNGKFDGVEPLGGGRLLYTSWSDSSVHLLANGRDRAIIRNLPNPADLGVDTRRHTVAVPISGGGHVEVWRLP
jgi:hypothetical protein